MGDSEGSWEDYAYMTLDYMEGDDSVLLGGVDTPARHANPPDVRAKTDPPPPECLGR